MNIAIRINDAKTKIIQLSCNDYGPAAWRSLGKAFTLRKSEMVLFLFSESPVISVGGDESGASRCDEWACMGQRNPGGFTPPYRYGIRKARSRVGEECPDYHKIVINTDEMQLYLC